MRIALASDHAGLPLKDELVAWLRDQGHDTVDLGTNNPDSVDYPEFGSRLAQTVGSGEAERGVAVCGSGIGISIAECTDLTVLTPGVVDSDRNSARQKKLA